MLRVATLIAGLAVGTAGCLWEPIQPAPIQGNDDAAVVIVAASPDSNQLYLLPGLQGDPCTAEVALVKVYSPRGAPLQASFFLNFNAQSNPLPLSIDGQTQFDLQPSQSDPNSFSLNQQQIRIDDFYLQLANGQANLLQVFVSDDLVDCPNPSTAPQPSTQPQVCYTTSWVWAIEPSVSCPVIQTF